MAIGNRSTAELPVSTGGSLEAQIPTPKAAGVAPARTRECRTPAEPGVKHSVVLHVIDVVFIIQPRPCFSLA